MVDYKPQGECTLIYGEKSFTPGRRYQGEFLDGLPHGTLHYICPETGTYKGEWQSGKKQGKGVYVFANGSRYEGEWADDKMEGSGVYYFFDGGKHEGEFKNNLKHGKGRQTGPDETIIEGTWENDKLHGEVRMRFGLFSEHRDGWLTATFTNGNPPQEATFTSDEDKTYNARMTDKGWRVDRFE